MIKQLPPMLSGSPNQQTAALREYLVKLVRELNSAANAPLAQGKGQNKSPAAYPGGTGGGPGAADIRQEAQRLRALIQKTAGDSKKYTDIKIITVGQDIEGAEQAAKNYTDGKSTILSTELSEDIRQSSINDRAYTDGKILEISGSYVAKSEFGSYKENAKLQMQAEARGVVESYDYDSKIESVQSGLDLQQQFQTSIEGQIRRGIMIDPDTGLEVLGIAISQTLQFTGQVKEEGGEKYYYLSPGQTLGLYTATGWQFWINGTKRGWYDSVDGLLHVKSQAIEERLLISDSWQISTDQGFCIEYIGE